MIGRNIPFLAISAALISCCAGSAAQPRTTSGGPPVDVVVTRDQWASGLTVAVGTTFRVPVPAAQSQWTVVYPHEILRLLTPADRLERPDPAGWRFEAAAAGSGDATFTGFVPPDAADRPNPPRFVLHVSVR
jgi:hypothetical protein